MTSKQKPKCELYLTRKKQGELREKIQAPIITAGGSEATDSLELAAEHSKKRRGKQLAS